MTQIDDKELEKLIMESFSREQLADEIVMRVEQKLKRKRVNATWKRWAGIVLFSFGFPVLFFFVALSCYFIYEHSDRQIYFLCLIFPVVAMFFSANTMIRELL